MKEQIIRSIGSVVPAAVLGGCLVWFFTPNPKPLDEGEWKSTGDGKTIVNSKTGELRITRTGLTVEESAKLSAQDASEAEQQRSRQNAKYAAQSAARDAQDAARQAEMRSRNNAIDAEIRVRNRGVYLKSKAFIESQNAKGFPGTVPYFNATWHRYTAAILAGQSIDSRTLHSLKKLVLEIQTYERIRVDKLQKDAKEAGVSLPVFAAHRGQSLDKACESPEWATFLAVLNEADFTESITSIEPHGFVLESDIVEADRIRK